MNGMNAPDREIREVIREEPVMRARILELLGDGPRTVPEIAEAIGAPTHEVVFWVMGMRRYGWLDRGQGDAGRRLLPVRAHREDVMTAQVDAGLYADLKRFGAADVSACFSCGTCTAICPLSDGDATFPRRIIRYAQVGMKDQLLSSKELWSCYQCAECTDSCPTGAGPSEFMAATRRYAIASYDKTRLARTMYLHPVVGTLIALALAAFFALFMYASHGPQDSETLAIFDFIPAPLIHDIGRRGDDHRLRGRPGRRGLDGADGSGDARVSAGAVCLAVALRCGAARPQPGTRSSWSRWGSAGIARTAPTMRPPSPGIGAAGSSTRPRCGGSWACSRPRSWTTAWTSWASRRPAHRCPSGTRSACWGRSRACCWCTA